MPSEPRSRDHSRPHVPAATIYDIAKKAGVSPSTVSRALNKPGRINAATAARIRAAATELGYRGNPMAKALPTGRTSTIGLVLSDITNPVYFDLVRGAETVAADHQYTLILADSQESAEKELATAYRLSPAVDGVIMVGSRITDDELHELASIKPLVVANRRVDGLDCLVPDVGPGLTSVLDHLQTLKHRSLAYISGPRTSWMSSLRSSTLLDEVPARGMTIVEIGPGAPTVAGGRETFRRVMASGVTAVLAYNDLMAIGLLHACRDAGVRVPEDLSIVGFDDIFGSDFTWPAITTVRSPLGRLGALAAQSLITQDLAMNGTDLATEFVERDSTARPSD